MQRTPAGVLLVMETVSVVGTPNPLQPAEVRRLPSSVLLADEMAELAAALRHGEDTWTSSSGMWMERSSIGDQVLRDPNGQIIARLDNLTPEELDEGVKRADEFANSPNPVVPLVSSATFDLPALARRVAKEIP